MIPSFLLAKLYVKGSLKNTDTGFEFTLKNIIDNTMLIGIGPVTVGEKSYEGAALTLTAGDKTISGDGSVPAVLRSCTHGHAAQDRCRRGQAGSWCAEDHRFWNIKRYWQVQV